MLFSDLIVVSVVTLVPEVFLEPRESPEDAKTSREEFFCSRRFATRLRRFAAQEKPLGPGYFVVGKSRKDSGGRSCYRRKFRNL